ncbi:2-dehydropantoate 2-reductase (plasmid) [Neorhizobium sp. SOG26]|uniref:ketopantoate reductase family protein n=1 Tax=Neorhizobium sp. SOG26 TaxID=2060726 RepID=UPI000E57EE74|nr:2-dehydropantoate 2-reductase [Neorhizobium sp. SOG26]AXV17887.1 2-dehydropantoate 2-reductase [Neorhizobium sp. SOG26]
MRICIYGAGAGGGHFAARLAQGEHQVSVIARGDHLVAIRENGLTLLSGEERLVARPVATDDPASLGPQDLVIVTVKATALAGVAEGLKPLVGERTRVLFTQNGMPWWYPVGSPENLATPPELPSFRLAQPFLAAVPAEHILGGLVYSANEVREPGVVFNNSPGANRVDIGAIAAGDTDAEPYREVFRRAGIASLPVADIREAIWKKLLFNMSGSVIALATGNQSSIARKDPGLAEVYVRIVREGLAIAAAHGYRLQEELVPEDMLKTTLDHKPSILQDYEQGRAMEVAEIVLAPLEFARSAGIDAPALQTIAAIVSRLARDRGLFV